MILLKLKEEITSTADHKANESEAKKNTIISGEQKNFAIDRLKMPPWQETENSWLETESRKSSEKNESVERKPTSVPVSLETPSTIEANAKSKWLLDSQTQIHATS